MKQPCIPLPTVQEAATTNWLDITEPRLFWLPKITRYTVSQYSHFIGLKITWHRIRISLDIHMYTDNQTQKTFDFSKIND